MTPRRGPGKWLAKASRSIAGRLTIWFTGTSVLLLLVKSLLVYLSVAPALSEQEELYVTARAELIATQLTSAIAAGEAPRFQTLLPPGTVGFARILMTDGQLLAEAQGMEAELPRAAIPPGDRPLVTAGRSGRQYWMASHVIESDETLLVQVASDVNEFRLIAPWNGRLWMGTLMALMASGIAGYWIARHGTTPLLDLARTVHAIGSSTLDHRIDPVPMPTELQPLCHSFNSMLDRLQHSFERVAQVTDDIAHELRTPLSVMMNQIDVALGTPRSADEYREVLESAREEISVLSDMVQRLLFLSRVENQSALPKPERLDLGAELTAVCDFYEPLATEAGLRLEVSTSPDPVQADGDRVLFRRAIGNLVANAIRYTPSGGMITLKVARDQSLVRVMVADTGCGIPADSLPHLSNRFFRLDRARETGAGHVGLGLAIVSAIVSLHRGSVDIASTLDRGTTVTIALPLAG
jgi:two-component system heavy metal sensor histidine kinase CusS